MHESEIKKYLKELMGTDVFKAQIALENDQINICMKKLAGLELSNDGLALKYAELRGAIKALTELQAIRKTLTSLS